MPLALEIGLAMAVYIILEDTTKLPTNYKTTRLSSAQRIRRSLEIAALFWGAALLAVFIPVLHFVLVPLFILVGIVAAHRRHKEVSFVSLENLKCLKCQADLKQKEVHQTVEAPSSKIYCYECRSSMRLEVEPHIVES